MADNTRVKWTTDGDYKNGVSPNRPKPNIVRIEQLTPQVRARYITGTNRLKGALEQQGVLYGNEIPADVFYGFTHKDNDITLGVTNHWSPNAGNGVFSQTSELLKNLPLEVGGGVIPFKVNVAGMAGSAISFTEKLIKNANALLNLSNKTVGGASIKDFTSVDLTSLSVKCAWYLPEQEALAKTALKSLYRMAYPKTLTPASAANLANAVTEVMLSTAGGGIKAAGDIVGAGLSFIPGAETATKELFELLTPNTEPPKKGETNDPSFIGKTIGAVYKAQDTVEGYITTVNPYPVRLSIGHYLDIEPLVIQSVSTHLSKETFINDSGMHLPIYAEATITFMYWMNPSPDQEFVKLFNTELFGTTTTSDITDNNAFHVLGG